MYFVYVYPHYAIWIPTTLDAYILLSLYKN